MSLHIVDRGKRNRVVIDPSVMAAGTGQITLTGNDSLVEIASGCTITHINLQFGDDCAFHAASNCRLAVLEIFASTSGTVSIGANTNFTADTRLYLHEAGAITFGERCLIGPGILAMNSDMHSIINTDSGERINPAGDVFIGDGVWLAANVVVLKKSNVGSGSVIGYGSVVSGTIPSNCLAAGSPARVLKHRVSWRPDLI
jgi:acetyltransferase-like isoleucine patch superfamily enzyme